MPVSVWRVETTPSSSNGQFGFNAADGNSLDDNTADDNTTDDNTISGRVFHCLLVNTICYEYRNIPSFATDDIQDSQCTTQSNIVEGSCPTANSIGMCLTETSNGVSVGVRYYRGGNLGSSYSQVIIDSCNRGQQSSWVR